MRPFLFVLPQSLRDSPLREGALGVSGVFKGVHRRAQRKAPPALRSREQLKVQSPMGASPQGWGFRYGRRAGFDQKQGAELWIFRAVGPDGPSRSPRWPRGPGRGFRLPLPTLTTSPLAFSRFLRRAAARACKNRSAAPAAAPCFVHWTRSPPLPWTQKRKSQRSKAGKNNSSWPVETFRASNGERVFSDRPLSAAPIVSSNPARRPIAEPPALRARPHGARNLKFLQTTKPPPQNHGARVCF